MSDPVSTATTEKADIGVTGLAVMGSNLARNFARKGFVTAVHNRTQAKTDALIAEHGADGAFVPSESSADFVASLAVPRKIIIMVKAGEPTDAVIDELAALLEPGDIIVDGGNAKFTDTHRRREAALRDEGHPLRRLRRLRRRGGRAERPVDHAGRIGASPTCRSARSWRRSPRTSTASRAARTSAPTAPATSSRWCTTASSTPTCSSSPRPTTCSAAAPG